MKHDFHSLKKREAKSIFQTYARYPLALSKGKGTRVYDLTGKEYLDLLAGISVCNLGHCHPELHRVMAEQAETLVHVSNLFYTEAQVELAEQLLRTCSMDKVFFCNSGAEANEAAIKLARRYCRKVKGSGAYEIITLEGSFHGRTLGTIAATGQDFAKDGFEPIPQGFVHVPPGDLEALEKNISPRTAAVMIEIIQGEGGVRPLDPDYLTALQQLCKDSSLLLIIDEVQTGMARTGAMWAYQHTGLHPDIFTTSKALANGLPLGAMLATEEIASGFAPGSHATTFGGGPVVCKTASKVLEIIHRDNLLGNAARLGEIAKEKLSEIKNAFPGRISEIRGRGLMMGIELQGEGKPVWESLLKAGYICNLAHGKVLRLLPPLIITEEEILSFVRALSDVLQE